MFLKPSKIIVSRFLKDTNQVAIDEPRPNSRNPINEPENAGIGENDFIGPSGHKVAQLLEHV